MKKILYFLIIAFTLILISNMSQAQAWEKSTKVLALGFGVSQFYYLDDYYYGNSSYIRRWYSPITGQINFQGEFGIHKYLGLGFTTGFGGRGRLRSDYAGVLNIPIGMIFNFHFYQLISDKTNKSIHADKLDLYLGANLGSGVAINYYTDAVRVVPIAFGGVHLGVRYYFTEKVGINCEVGWGKSLVNLGFVFKLAEAQNEHLE